MILFILSSRPYDGSDNIYGALRLVKKLVEVKQEVKIFCISDAVDLVRFMVLENTRLKRLECGV